MAMHLLNQQLAGRSPTAAKVAVTDLPPCAVLVTPMPQNGSPISNTQWVNNMVPSQSPPSSGRSTSLRTNQTFREVQPNTLDNGEGDDD